MLIATTALSFTPTAAASSCTGGAVAVHCSFSCTAGQSISVSATGVGARVEAICGNVSVSCSTTGTFTFCSRVGSAPQYSDSNGVCWVKTLTTVLTSCTG